MPLESTLPYTIIADDVTVGIARISIPLGKTSVKIFLLQANLSRAWVGTAVGYYKGNRLYPLSSGYTCQPDGGARFVAPTGYLIQQCDSIDALIYKPTLSDTVLFANVMEFL